MFPKCSVLHGKYVLKMYILFNVCYLKIYYSMLLVCCPAICILAHKNIHEHKTVYIKHIHIHMHMHTLTIETTAYFTALCLLKLLFKHSLYKYSKKRTKYTFKTHQEAIRRYHKIQRKLKNKPAEWHLKKGSSSWYVMKYAKCLVIFQNTNTNLFIFLMFMFYLF